MAKKQTPAEVQARFNEVGNGEYSLVNGEFDLMSKVTLKHNCGELIELGRLKRFITEGSGRCKKCYPVIRQVFPKFKTIEELNTFLKKNYPDYKCIDKFEEEIKVFYHSKCNKEVSLRLKELNNERCKQCPTKRGKYAIKKNYLQDILHKAVDGADYLWLEDYKNNNKLKHTIQHKVCGLVYPVRPNDFQQGYRCPDCCRNSSKEELLIKSILDSNNIAYERNFIITNSKHKDRLELDFFIPSLNLGIEYDGSQHFYSAWGKDVTKHEMPRDKKKNELVKKKSIKLVRFNFKHSSSIIQDVLIKLINNKLPVGLVDKNKIYFYSKKIVLNETEYYTNARTDYFGLPS